MHYQLGVISMSHQRTRPKGLDCGRSCGRGGSGNRCGQQNARPTNEEKSKARADRVANMRDGSITGVAARKVARYVAALAASSAATSAG